MLSELNNLYTGVIYDALRDMGITDCVLSYNIKPTFPVKKLVGPVWTSEGETDHTISKDESLSGWSKLLSKAEPGHIMVCAANNTAVSHMGELSAEVLKNKGVLGVVTDGGTRDVEFLEKINLPVYCSYATPKDIVGNWKVTNFGKPIVIDGVKIVTGDYLLADADGIVIIPKKLTNEVIEKAMSKLNQENIMRESILSGMDPHEAYLKYRIF